MITTLKNMLGFGPAQNYQELINKGAQIVDVRTRGEFSSGHIKGSINIPLNELSVHAKKLKQNKPIIVCCASGMRSASAKSTLSSMGFTDVYNGGGWASLNNKL